MKIKYIDDDKQHGIEYDWGFIAKELKKLKCPENVYNPFKVHNVKSGRWFVDLSERNTGKTTNWLLVAMLMNKHYGTQGIYIRELVDMIMPKHALQLFETILQFGYVQTITDNKYNSIKYKSRGYYYYNTETDELAQSPFMLSLSLDENYLNKSSFNAPTGDLIIFDEFISKYNYANEFVDLCDTLKTVIRERDSAVIVLLANTIDKHNFIFKELGIYEIVQTLDINQQRLFTNPHGTEISVSILGRKMEDMPEHKKEHNRKFFGFANSKLNSIRGGEWAIPLFPHIPKMEEKDNDECLFRNRYIRHNDYLLNLELHHNEKLGACVFVHKAKKTYDDSIIYTLDTVIDNKNCRYKWGKNALDNLLLKLYLQNKFYYATNFEGELTETYLRECNLNKRRGV